MRQEPSWVDFQAMDNRDPGKMRTKWGETRSCPGWKPKQRLLDSLGEGDGGKSQKDQTARVSRKESQRRDGGIEWSLEVWKHSLVSAESSSHAYEDTTQCWRGNFERLILDNSSHCLSEVKNIAPFTELGEKSSLRHSRKNICRVHYLVVGNNHPPDQTWLQTDPLHKSVLESFDLFLNNSVASREKSKIEKPNHSASSHPMPGI